MNDRFALFLSDGENADVTIIAQAPKLAGVIPYMTENIESIIGCEKGSINIKATTEEQLGFTGRKEGISAHAVVLLKEGQKNGKQ